MGAMGKMGKNKELKTFLVLLFFSFLLLLLDRFGVLNPVKGFSERLFLPPKKVIYRNWQEIKGEIKEIKKSRNCGQAKELEEKIVTLEQKVAQLTTHNSQLAIENKAAHRLLGTPLPAEWQFLPAQIAGLVNSVLAIDKGESNGVKIGQAVLVENIFVGKVEQVEKYQSWVRLSMAKSSKMLVKVIPDKRLANTEALNPAPRGAESTEAKARGLLVGYGEKMRLEKVLQEEMLAEGDLVVTGEFPPNLVIGKITKVIKKDVEIYQEAEVKPLVDYQRLEVVFLLK